MHPSLQESVLEQVEQKRLVGMDSMNLWIDITPNELRSVLKRVDVVKIDDSEARDLAGVYNLRKAAAAVQGLGPKMLIATRGSHGAMLFNATGHVLGARLPARGRAGPHRRGRQLRRRLLRLPGSERRRSTPPRCAAR